MSDLVQDRFYHCSGQQYPGTKDYRTNWPPAAGEADFSLVTIPLIAFLLLDLTIDFTYFVLIHIIKRVCSRPVPWKQIWNGAERLDTFADESVA